MSLQTASIAVLLASLIAPSATPADDLPASVERGKELLEEGDKLADRKEPTEAVLKYKQAFEQLLPGIRQLKFKHEVKRDATNREDLKALLIKELDDELTPAEVRTNQLGMKVLGSIPRDINGKQ